MNENNEKRCIAHQIIHDLFEAKEIGQIQLLYMAATLAYKGLDREGLLRAAQNTVDTIKVQQPPGNWTPEYKAKQERNLLDGE